MSSEKKKKTQARYVLSRMTNIVEIKTYSSLTGISNFSKPYWLCYVLNSSTMDKNLISLDIYIDI